MRWKIATLFTLAAVCVLAAGCEDRYHRREERGREEAFRARCGRIIDRIENDRAKIDEIDPAQHPRARQWFIDDLHNAERDLDRCRENY
jgi:hypothetical protein